MQGNNHEPEEKTSEVASEPGLRNIEMDPITESSIDRLLNRQRQIRLLIESDIQELKHIIDNLENNDQLLIDDTIDPEGAIAALAEISAIEIGNHPERIQKCKLALNVLVAIKAQIQTEITRIDDLISTEGSTVSIDRELDALERAHFVKRARSVFLGRRLRTQKSEVEKNQTNWIEEKYKKLGMLDQLIRLEKQLREKQVSSCIFVAESVVSDIKNKYKDFYEEVIEDGSVVLEIQTMYTDDYIVTEVERYKVEYNISEQEIEDFYTALNRYFKSTNGSKADHEECRRILDKFTSGKFRFLAFKINKIPSFDEVSLIGHFTAVEAADFIEQVQYYTVDKLKDRIEERDIIYRLRRHFGSDNFFEKEIMDEFRNKEDKNLDMEFWQAVKASPGLNQIFGQHISEDDHRIYEAVINRSPNDFDGYYINALRYYATPEGIRNLVLLVAADVREKITLNANITLCRLASSKQWPQLLDEAIRVYPDLSQAKNLLASWNLDGNSNHPLIKDLVSQFALNVFQDQSLNNNIRLIARDSLNDFSLLNYLVETKIITHEEAHLISEASDILKKLGHEEGMNKSIGEYSNISDDEFKLILRQTIKGLLDFYDKNDVDISQHKTKIKQLIVLSRKIIDKQKDKIAIAYLSTSFVIKNLIRNDFPESQNDIFLNAYENFAQLTTDNELLETFCLQFRNQVDGNQIITMFSQLVQAYRGYDYQFKQLMLFINNGVISPENALEIGLNAKSILQSPNFYWVVSSAHLFLPNKTGHDFFVKVDNAGVFSLDDQDDITIGTFIKKLWTGGEEFYFNYFLTDMIKHEIKLLETLFSSQDSIEITQENWKTLLIAYAYINTGHLHLGGFSEETKKKIVDIMSSAKARDICLIEYRKLWLNFLQYRDLEKYPLSLMIINEFINSYGGIDHLSQITSLNSLINAVQKSLEAQTTTKQTREKLSQTLVSLENRFTREKWSNENRTDFYNISNDIISAAPSLYSDFTSLFERLSPQQLKKFAQNIFPLYKAKLVLMERKNESGNKTFDTKSLLEIRKDIREFTEVAASDDDNFERQRTKILDSIKVSFKERFGIIKIPTEIDHEHIRSFTNISLYLGNLNGRNETREAILGFYLALMLNGLWNVFRQGEEINLNELLTPEISKIIAPLLEQRKDLNPLTPEKLGISSDEMPEFNRLLQIETQNVAIGNVETIDAKLRNIIGNLRGLEDLDLYPDLIDKQRIELLLRWGNKRVGATVAKMYQSIINPGRNIQFSGDENKIKQEILIIISSTNLELSSQTLKDHFQDGMKPFSMVVNLLNYIDENKIEQEVDVITELLSPSPEIIDLFRRLGEDFKPTSGAMALSQDLSYLHNLVVKRSEDLTTEEKELLIGYTDRITEQLTKLQNLYSQIQDKFNGLKQGANASSSSLLSQRIEEITRIIRTQDSLQVVFSAVTGDMNVIIENIRECLSCNREGCNNDTNLTFGDGNKFYLYSAPGENAKSNADQIMFVVPIVRSDGTQEVSFVVDKIYDNYSTTVLFNQIESVIKKYLIIKQKFPHIKLSVFVTDAAIRFSGGADSLIREIQSRGYKAIQDSVQVDVTPSAMADHYIEFGGGSRTVGVRTVSGVLIGTDVGVNSKREVVSITRGTDDELPYNDPLFY